MSLNKFIKIEEEKIEETKKYIIIKGNPPKEKDKKKEESLLLKNLNKFINNGFKRKFFTKRIYEYLHLHCDFIAHFDIEAFYNTYFISIQRFNNFIEEIKNLKRAKNTTKDVIINKFLNFSKGNIT